MVDDPDRITENQVDKWSRNLIHGIFATNAAVTYLVKPNMHLRRQWGGVEGKKSLYREPGLY